MVDTDIRFLETYNRFYRQVYAYCRRRTSADMAEEAVADTFLTVWRKPDEIPSGAEALPWLYAVAYRVLSHQWRSESRRSRLTAKLVSLGVSPPSLPEDIVVMRQESRQLLTALAALKPIDQEVLRLSAWEQLSGADIAQTLGITPGAVRQRQYTARRRLAEEFNRLDKRKTSAPAVEKGGVR